MKSNKLKLEKFQITKLNNLSLIKGGNNSINNMTTTTDTDGGGGGGGGQTDDSLVKTYEDNGQ
ncbi:hypothetical protein [Aquimarina brevivitae]|uniref:Uncharacterized protein n=1 Tax=Aquimarina brevivitae TaxID=323412 RepID=A0A4Q7P1X9_9FLAO|nr:hypothetical protein [Aquimarina brevivitae]RZS93871.1 hypothetical protein EV197_2452 [Aquimarina brevivitae]